MKTIKLTPDQDKLCQEWIRAKEAEEQWVAYRLTQADLLLQTLESSVQAEIASLAGSDKLTTELSLGGVLNLKVGNELKIGEAQSLQFVTHFPHLINVAFKAKYSPVARVVLNMLHHDNSPAGQELRASCEVKPIKPSFSKAK